MTKKKKKRILFWRILIGFLIVSNMAVIFMFSAQSSAQSAALSKKITDAIVRILPEDYVEKLLNKTVTSTTQKPNTEKPKETTPEETSASTPEETSASTPEETSASTPEETSASTPEETSASTPEETSASTPEETSASAPEETQPEETTPPKEQKPQKPKDPLTKEQQTLAKKSHVPIRKIAHMLEFGSLATLSLLFLITWPGKLWWRYLVSLGFTLFYAGTDEFHQLFIAGRGPQLSDVLVDFWGALIACTIVLIIIAMVRQVQKMKRTGSTVKDVWCEFVEHVLQRFSCIKAFVTNQSATHKKEQTAEHNEENIAENKEEKKEEQIAK